ncbi:hypothetical protein EVJ58_g3996 [Rhodofomes roseus]|uniref:Uncharacterized protein n=1 Tax=Rhodofomes roseus TaxID=34475 RepID=A0A4Y9YL77_9APHY|nr:hypothetical protein EVJ58_g3996 [Rhodofomes roseus]
MEATIEGVDVACLVIEWCGEPHPEDPRLFSAQKLELAVLLHKEGWSHGDLLDVDSHHFVVAEDDETGNPLRLVDLTKASEHRGEAAQRPFEPSLLYGANATEIQKLDLSRRSQLSGAFIA